MNDPVTYKAAQHVFHCEVAGEVVLLDTQAARYYGLDVIGAKIWTLTVNGASQSEICDRLETEFDVSRAQVQNDVSALIGEFLQRNLIARS